MIAHLLRCLYSAGASCNNQSETSSCLEYPTRLHHQLFVIPHFQTISQDVSIESIILST